MGVRGRGSHLSVGRPGTGLSFGAGTNSTRGCPHTHRASSVVLAGYENRRIVILVSNWKTDSANLTVKGKDFQCRRFPFVFILCCILCWRRLMLFSL